MGDTLAAKVREHGANVLIRQHEPGWWFRCHAEEIATALDAATRLRDTYPDCKYHYRCPFAAIIVPTSCKGGS